MSPDELSGPDLAGVVADANCAGLPHVVIGGFSVIANGYLRATMDSDLLVPDGSEADLAIVRFLEAIHGERRTIRSPAWRSDRLASSSVR
jgi:hypothetical protein